MQADLSNFTKQYRTGHAQEWDIEPGSREWLTTIPCTKACGGEIFTAGEKMLGYCSELNNFHGHLKTKLMTMPGVVMAQEGDAEFIVHFPVEMLDAVAKVVHAIKRKHLSEEHKEKLKATQFISKSTASDDS